INVHTHIVGVGGIVRNVSYDALRKLLGVFPVFDINGNTRARRDNVDVETIDGRPQNDATAGWLYQDLDLFKEAQLLLSRHHDASHVFGVENQLVGCVGITSPSFLSRAATTDASVIVWVS